MEKRKRMRGEVEVEADVTSPNGARVGGVLARRYGAAALEPP